MTDTIGFYIAEIGLITVISIICMPKFMDYILGFHMKDIYWIITGYVGRCVVIEI